MSLTVLLFSLAKVKPYVTQMKVEEKKISDTFGICQLHLRQWVIKEDIIGGSFFGGGRNGGAELKVHTRIYMYSLYKFY